MRLTIVGVFFLSCVGVIAFMFGGNWNDRSGVPLEARGINPVLEPNRFRESFVNGIVADLRENGASSKYAVKEGGRVAFESSNIFVRKNDGVIFVGYFRDPLGPFKVFNLASGKWNYEE